MKTVIKLLGDATQKLKEINDPQQAQSREKNIDALKITLENVIKNFEPQAAQMIGKGKKKAVAASGRKKKGGADVNLASQGSQIMNTESLLQNTMNPIYAAKPWEGPMPFSAGLSIPTDLTAGLPSAGLLNAMDPAIVTGGGKKKKKKTSSKK